MASRPVSLAQVRLAGRIPRIALVAAAVATTLGATVRTFSPRPAQAVKPIVSRATDTTAAEGLAERFARAYMTVSPQDDEARQRTLGQLGLADAGGVADHAGGRTQHVTASLVAAVDRSGAGRTTVTVAVDDGSRWLYLAVPVARTRSGALFVSGPPAIVGPPSTAAAQLAAPEDEVQDRVLQQVAGRVVRHYLAGDAIDLAADLAPHAAVSLPRTTFRVASVDQVTWAVPQQVVAVAVSARGHQGLRLTLRYELAVTRRAGRWLVRTVVVNPQARESP